MRARTADTVRALEEQVHCLQVLVREAGLRLQALETRSPFPYGLPRPGDLPYRATREASH